MTCRLRTGGLFSLVLVVALTGGAVAQTTGGSQSGGSSGGGGDSWGPEADRAMRAGTGAGWTPPVPAAPIAVVDAERVVRRIQEIGAYCGWFGRDYEIDCLRDQYTQMRAWLPDNAVYMPLRQALWQAERDLGNLVRQYQDPQAAGGVAPARGNPTRLRATRVLVRTPGAQAARAARAVIDNTQTVLLRSVGASDPRRVAFQRMARALDSNKVLLRSRA